MRRCSPFTPPTAAIIHNQHDPTAFDDPTGVEGVLRDLGHPVALAEAATSTDFDDVLRTETAEALDRCGGNIGTPVLSFAPPDGSSFFGPVISKAPKGADALALWDAVTALGTNPYFSELKPLDPQPPPVRRLTGGLANGAGHHPAHQGAERQDAPPHEPVDAVDPAEQLRGHQGLASRHGDDVPDAHGHALQHEEPDCSRLLASSRADRSTTAGRIACDALSNIVSAEPRQKATTHNTATEV